MRIRWREYRVRGAIIRSPWGFMMCRGLKKPGGLGNEGPGIQESRDKFRGRSTQMAIVFSHVDKTAPLQLPGWKTKTLAVAACCRKLC